MQKVLRGQKVIVWRGLYVGLKRLPSHSIDLPDKYSKIRVLFSEEGKREKWSCQSEKFAKNLFSAPLSLAVGLCWWASGRR
ncbi:hypothetical protein A0J57_19390 [Sphingobium sp. 22B]|nr:hypothetical protein A0J57_19390 [Sphingobium sp. 22B]OAP30362.1 hypothetical protein A8O16_18700 [Sphingobium sp. 20006FA]PNQ02571.1 hypothetical protein A8G00_13355 [Sphingobium sp. SA916]